MEEWDVEQVVAWAQLHKLTAALDPETIRSNDIEGELLMDLDDEARQLKTCSFFLFSNRAFPLRELSAHRFIYMYSSHVCCADASVARLLRDKRPSLN